MKRQLLGYIPVNIANIVVSFGTIAILTRLLDANEFGRFALTIAAMHFIHMALYTWIEAAMARFYARAEREGSLASHIKTLYVAGLFTGLVCLPVLLLFVHLSPLEPRMKMLLSYALILSALNLFFNISKEAHKAAHRIGRFSALQSSQSIAGFAIGIVLVMVTPLRELAPFIGIMVAVIAALIIDLPFMLRFAKGGHVNQNLTADYFRYGMPICLSLILAYMLSQGDLFFIKYFMGDAAVGAYNAGYNLANRSLDVLFIWLAMAVTPIAITTLEHQGSEETRRILLSYSQTLLVLIVPAATGIALVASNAGFILGDSVRVEAVRIMPWIAFAGLINGVITYYVHQAFVLVKKTQLMAMTMIVPVILNFALNIIFIPKYGIDGAVIATLASYGVALVVTIVVARRYFDLPLPWKTLAQCALASLLMALIVVKAPIPDSLPDVAALLLKAAIGICVYGPVALALNIADCRTLVRDVAVNLKSRRAV